MLQLVPAMAQLTVEAQSSEHLVSLTEPKSSIVHSHGGVIVLSRRACSVIHILNHTISTTIQCHIVTQQHPNVMLSAFMADMHPLEGLAAAFVPTTCCT